MAFFRIKKIKGKEYVYVVENEWKAGSSRQRVKDYLGRVFRLDLKNDIDFKRFIKTDSIKNYIDGNGSSKIINDLLEWELFRFNVDKGIFSIDLIGKKIQKNERNVALLINEGFLCSLTLRGLFEFKPGEENTDAYLFARAFVEAGVKVPQEVFVGLFGKLHKNIEKRKSDFTW